ncbi:MAG: ubiquitin-conjugating enzyme E2 [Promethearchaeota archaeon]
MPELPYEIWKERINNELKTLRENGALEEDSVEMGDDVIKFIIKFNAKGLVKDDSNNLVTIFRHRVQIEINRKFPYPGGIKFIWLSPIFHPNIDPYETGYICLNVLKKWSQLNDLNTTLKALEMLVKHPNPEDPLNYPTCLEAAQYFFENPPSEEDDDDDIVIIPD